MRRKILNTKNTLQQKYHTQKVVKDVWALERRVRTRSRCIAAKRYCLVISRVSCARAEERAVAVQVAVQVAASPVARPRKRTQLNIFSAMALVGKGAHKSNLLSLYLSISLSLSVTLSLYLSKNFLFSYITTLCYAIPI